jgi:hypothetical protein
LNQEQQKFLHLKKCVRTETKGFGNLKNRVQSSSPHPKNPQINVYNVKISKPGPNVMKPCQPEINQSTPKKKKGRGRGNTKNKMGRTHIQEDK